MEALALLLEHAVGILTHWAGMQIMKEFGDVLCSVK